MTALIWRVLIAIVCVLVTYALIPPVSRIIGFTITGDFWLVIRICIAALAVLYILLGSSPIKP